MSWFHIFLLLFLEAAKAGKVTKASKATEADNENKFVGKVMLQKLGNETIVTGN